MPVRLVALVQPRVKRVVGLSVDGLHLAMALFVVANGERVEVGRRRHRPLLPAGSRVRHLPGHPDFARRPLPPRPGDGSRWSRPEVHRVRSRPPVLVRRVQGVVQETRHPAEVRGGREV